MNGKIVAGSIVISALAFGGLVYWSQEYGHFEPVSADAAAAEQRLTSVASGAPEPILTTEFEGIEGDSSPLRYRACFRTSQSLAMLTETYQVYDAPTPTIAPAWFDCFDAEAIGTALESGEAVAFLSQKDIRPGVDRVIAVFPDGRAYAWHQINETLEH
ncbi:DUF6446 family protein [Frigidibacter oleivorans]|uniref:DUF6446 family protein n=1 Tax=Frigidibacter oleivorans TaxID=2487129 RepID=UPI000F8C5D2B|nr:DUF6446 family protein [Frigidibacter oleivorans]